MSARQVASLTGVSHTQVLRIERAEAASVPVGVLERLAPVLGCEISLGLHVVGSPVRDRAHLALLARFAARLHPSIRWRTEVPVPIAGDLRSADGLAVGRAFDATVEAETRLDDVQAAVRKLRAKQRDLGTTRAILLLADTRHNRWVVAANPDLRGEFPIGPRAALQALAQGEDPRGDCPLILREDRAPRQDAGATNACGRHVTGATTDAGATPPRDRRVPMAASVRYRGPMTTPIADLPDPAAVVFDLDGTLVDTNETRIEAWLETFDEAGLRATRDTLVPLIGLDGKRLAREVAALNAVVIDDHRAEEIDKRCGELFDRRNRDPRPLPGVTALVEVIEARDLPWSIATSSRKDQVGTSVDALRLRDEPRIVDASHVQHAKPEPDLLLRAAQELGLDPARCWYIGDSPWDMVASVAAAMIPIGVTAGAVVGRAQLEGAGAAAVVETLDEVAAALRRRAAPR